MPRRPEIGTVQLYPNRPLKKSDKNGYVLKFYCPIKRKRIRRNCGTRDKREARKILRECRERLLNGEYERSDGAITAQHVTATPLPATCKIASEAESKLWNECFEKYRQHRQSRIRETSLDDAVSRLNIAERIFENHRQAQGIDEGLPVHDVMTLDKLEFLQARLLAGDEGRYDHRSPNTVNGILKAIMSFVRFCHTRGWINSIPPLEKIKTDEVMKGRPVTTEEFERMLEVTGRVVGSSSAPSWQFALNVLWESGFRIGDLMDFHWIDDRHINPVFPTRNQQHPTLIIPSTQKNGRVQEIPMLPGLQELLLDVPKTDRFSWVVNPAPMEYQIDDRREWFQPAIADLAKLSKRFSNCSIAKACNVSDTTVRKWLAKAEIRRDHEFNHDTGVISETEIARIRRNARRQRHRNGQRSGNRLSTDRVSRVISLIGKEAGVLVQRADSSKREKFASAHDLRRGCALRLINAGVSAETLKIVMRHKDFATTEKHYGAFRSAQSAATELNEKLSTLESTPLVGGLMGGIEKAPQLSAEELLKLKSLLNSL